MVNNWLSRNKKPWCVTFTNFCGVNTPTMADFKQPKEVMDRDAGKFYTQLALMSQYELSSTHHCHYTNQLLSHQ